MAKSAPLYRTYWPEVAKHVNTFGVDGIKKSRWAEIEGYAQFYLANKTKYLAVEAQTRVPAPLIACIHRRESEATHPGEAQCNFNTYLGNGQPLNRRTTIVPEGRGPFCATLPATMTQFIAGAKDAFAIDGLSAVLQTGDDWVVGQVWGSFPVEKMLYFAEKLNGWGYNWHGITSPYIWGGTNIQEMGKYTSDGHLDTSVWDSQPGVAPILWMIGHLDSTIHFTRES